MLGATKRIVIAVMLAAGSLGVIGTAALVESSPAGASTYISGTVWCAANTVSGVWIQASSGGVNTGRNRQHAPVENGSTLGLERYFGRLRVRPQAGRQRERRIAGPDGDRRDGRVRALASWSR